MPPGIAMLDATFVIFTILTEFRRGVAPVQLWKTFSRFGKALSPRLPFWLHLCQRSGLLGVSSPYRPSRSVKAWLALPPKEQTLVLLDAWLSFPKNQTDRSARKTFLRRLKQGTAFLGNYQHQKIG
jgi:hypothetical protein